ncbi:glycoside hydrolase family 73 protein [Romboutsia sp.]|uniref:glycoside hydrolase family 73 protein n=1 Tax=Romboutsia sp. TaxID=1965302 RepID=UPI003F3CBAD4
MGKKKIKHLGKKKYRNIMKSSLNKVGIFIAITVSIVALVSITKYVEDLYKGKNISGNTIEFYMNIADEIGEGKAQLSWKELLAIDMVKYNKDLTSIKKKEVIDVGKKFIVKEENKDGVAVYKLKTFDKVLDEIGFDKVEKNNANMYLEDLKNTSLGGANIENQKEKINFLKNISEKSKANYYEYGILPSITTAQAILESGWGQSSLTKESNNIFGIKADQRWNGKRVEVSTGENYNDRIVASFRVYNSIEDSIKDQGKFLVENKRYSENGLFKATHYTTQAKALEDAGYSTKKNKSGEPIYADMLIHLIRDYNLQLLDREVETIK